MSEHGTPRDARWTAEIATKIQFYDLDPLQVVWHGNYAKFFEQARCAVLDQIDYNYLRMKESGYSWPIIDMQVRYLQPITFGQEIVVSASIVEWEHRLTLRYLIRDAATGQRLTKGSTMQVAVGIATQLMCLQSPPVLFERLGVSPTW